MKYHLVLIMVVFFVACGTVLAGSYAPGNMGKLSSYTKIGHIVGNAMSWDYALLFKLRKRGDAYRALADIEAEIQEHSSWRDGEDELVAMGAMDRCVIVSIKSDSKLGELYSKYARASRQANLEDVNAFDWTHTDEWADLIDGSIPLSAACR